MTDTPTATEAGDTYRDKQFQIGLRFQDYVTNVLYRRGMPIVGYASLNAQCNRGENLAGIEIKRDDIFRNTNRLFMEVAESDKNGAFRSSGVCAGDHWLYLIGDEKTMYIFSSRELLRLHEEGRHKYFKDHLKEGFYLPIEEAEHIKVRKIEPKVKV